MDDVLGVLIFLGIIGALVGILVVAALKSVIVFAYREMRGPFVKCIVCQRLNRVTAAHCGRCTAAISISTTPRNAPKAHRGFHADAQNLMRRDVS